MADIFISYASEDRARVHPLAEALMARDWTVWWDRHIPVGKSFDRVIEEEIGKAKVVLVLWSAISIAKEWVRNEADEAKSRDILVPVFIDEVKPPLAFRMLNGANLSRWQPGTSNPEFDKLTERITELIGQQPAAQSKRPDAAARDSAKPPLTQAWLSRFFNSKVVRGGLAFAALGVFGIYFVLSARQPQSGPTAKPAVQEKPHAKPITVAPKEPSPPAEPDMQKSIEDLAKAFGGAVPATSMAKAFHKPALGLSVAYLTPAQSASSGGALPAGAAVMEVKTSGPMAVAGIQAGDVILAVNGKKIESEDDLRQAIRRVDAGKSKFAIQRQQKTKTVIVDCPKCTLD